MCNKITTLPGEVWFDIPGYEGFYQLSNKDRLKSVARMVRIKNGKLRQHLEKIKDFTTDSGSGYMIASLWKDGKGTTSSLHQLKLITFVGPCPAGMECRHLDGNSCNNDLSNLTWGTHTENVQDNVLHGTTVKGKKRNSWKLKGKQKEIVSLWNAGGHSVGSLARLFGVSKCAIYGCIQRHSIEKEVA